MPNSFSVSAYIENESSILLVKHVKQQAWVPIGGRLEPDETPFNAMEREVREETGFVLGADFRPIPIRSFELGLNDLVGMLAYEEHEVLPSGRHMCFSYLLHSRHRHLASCAEYTEVRWLNWPQFSAISRHPGPTLLDGVAIPHNVVKLLSRCFSYLHGSGW
jgi:8-oxo-dGTP pyrophosphatase MutT (NUDIX family)